MANNYIEIENLSFVYEDEDEGVIQKGSPALNNVSFSVKEGEYISILGHKPLLTA